MTFEKWLTESGCAVTDYTAAEKRALWPVYAVLHVLEKDYSVEAIAAPLAERRQKATQAAPGAKVGKLFSPPSKPE